MATENLQGIHTIAELSLEAVGPSRVHDLFVADTHAAVRWSHGSTTGLSLLRFADGVLVQSWSAARPDSAGPWPGPEDPGDLLTRAANRAQSNASTTRSAMEQYCEIRAEHARADELRGLFIDPMVVHGSGPTRIESIEEFVERVRNEPAVTPAVRFQPDHLVFSGDRALLRWSYFDGPVLQAAGLTMYAIRDRVIVERWQASLPAGAGWR